ncbi:hypothetical protein [Pedobacter rhizosphaerae]|uniref:Uncharacterized protein n=1 Tax=Pedobacter rhizosphaerae TaxID=390241 RepID=A0A1H9PKI2_9SPHI|nr:hypothetical protein [Pedobacter rhizosphaerae]SER48637.1 hypothetical protein SAMN04488023_1103 [Pedobacter rhizosphaerae]
MSYDLFFYKRNSASITQADIESYLNNLPNREGNNDSQWLFRNEGSGAYWSFEYHQQHENDPVDIEIDEGYEGYEDFEDTRFTFNINYVRPNFFEEEAFSVVDKLASDLNLYILNPQGEAIPRQYGKGILQTDWTAMNMSHAKTYFDEWGHNYLEPNQSDYSADYNRKKAEIQQQYGEEYFVPQIFYLKRHGSRLIETLCMWPEHVPYILPKIDIILTQKRISVLFWKKEEAGLIRCTDLIEQLGDLFSKLEGHLVLHPQEAQEIAKAFNKLKLFDTLSGYGESIGGGNFKLEVGQNRYISNPAASSTEKPTIDYFRNGKDIGRFRFKN